ncbi:MAG: error-prone DNA polymerase [Verrucomicrobiales bacterium]|nr:error-prone DNA polymerase [Verrucomicrobiales bacterium]
MIDPSDYRELHLRSAFSFLRGASSPESLADRTGQCGLPAAALCDRNGFYGSVRFHQRAKENGFRAIVGTELTMEDGSVIPLLVKSREGYRAVSRLLTRAQLRAAKGTATIAWNELEAIADEAAFLTGDAEGPLERGWRADGRRGMEGALAKMKTQIPERHLHVELQRHAIRGEEALVRAKVDLAAAHRLPLLATNGVCYDRTENRQVQDVFTCLREHTTLDAAGRLLAVNGERHVKTAEEMVALFHDHPGAILGTRRLAEEIDFSLENLGYEFPRYEVPPGHSMESYLAETTWRGAKLRYGKLKREVKDQITRELDLIGRLGFSGYFLIVWSLVKYCRENDILVQGRGSAANSAVCYCLGITPVDPVGAKLLFERFLSEGRRSWPDIDLDLPSGERREQVIQEVYRRYGRHGAAMTANVITYRGRSAVREIGKVLEFPEEMLARFSDLYASGDYPHTLAFSEQVAQSGITAEHPRAGALARLYGQVYGLPRHLGQHSGGMVICQGALDTVVPIENASMPGRTVVQWDKNDCEDMGIIKVDLLGLGMMAVLQDTLALAGSRGRPVDLAQIPKDDTATYDLMCSADTIGVFQIESRAQMNTLRRMQPRCFYDVVIEVAIVRPGPIAGGLAHPYLERRAGREPIDYIDAKLQPTLERTLGVPMFQEQVLKMAMVMADFSGSEAEELRRALSFHRSHERMRKVEAKLRRALEERGVGIAAVEKIVRVIGSFALYGFPESHAISFGLLAYASSYLKVHRAAEFYTGLLNNQPMGFYSPATLVQEGKRRGLRFLPPCVVDSDWGCEVIDDATIRLGLVNVLGLGEANVRAMVRERSRCRFVSLEDFRQRTGFGQAEMRRLAAVGALAKLASTRRQALWAVEARPLEQGDLFAEAAVLASAKVAESPLPEMSYHERIRADFSGMGLTTGKHPMALARQELPPGILSAAVLATMPDGAMATTAGAVICRQRPGTAKGVVFITLEDETGLANAIVYSDTFEKYRLVITTEPFLLIHGRVQRDDEGTTHLMATRIEAIGIGKLLPAAASHDFH